MTVGDRTAVQRVSARRIYLDLQSPIPLAALRESHFSQSEAV